MGDVFRRAKVLSYPDCIEFSKEEIRVTHSQAFVKCYPSPKDGVYPEIASLTRCFWYPPETQTPAIELEPLGPRNTIEPGGTASFKEDGYLIPHPFPDAEGQLDLDQLAAQVEREAQ
jgi:hypothetical protein